MWTNKRNGDKRNNVSCLINDVLITVPILQDKFKGPKMPPYLCSNE